MYYQRFRDIREDHDIRQSTIAELLQTTQQTYSIWETGKREIPLCHAITLAKFYHVSLDWLVGLSDDKGDHYVNNERKIKGNQK